jgi:hypothetical protein
VLWQACDANKTYNKGAMTCDGNNKTSLTYKETQFFKRILSGLDTNNIFDKKEFHTALTQSSVGLPNLVLIGRKMQEPSSSPNRRSNHVLVGTFGRSEVGTTTEYRCGEAGT